MTPGSSTFYRRPLPPPLVPFASPQGRLLFEEALAAGGLEGFFALSEQFHTQSDPAFCGLGTLVVALNALEIDPGRIWKGPWRWYAEELLDCCLPLEEVQKKGLTLEELACLARCNGAAARAVHADETTVDAFRDQVRAASAAARGPVVIAAYARSALGQTGGGHFSPVAGFHAGRDLALVLDVARFKYPPHWVPVPLLFEAMRPGDPESGRPRGFVTLERAALPLALLFRVRADAAAGALAAALIDEIPAALAAAGATRAADLVKLVDERLGAPLVGWLTRALDGPEGLLDEHRALVHVVLDDLRASGAFALVRMARGGDTATVPLRDEALAMLLLALPDELLGSWPAALGAAIGPHRRTLTGALAAEAGALREQLASLHLWRRRARGCAPAGGCASATALERPLDAEPR